MNPDSCSTRPNRDTIEVSVGVNEQALIYFPGDGEPLFLTDQMRRGDLLNYIQAPIARAVLAARLRAFADMLETSPLDALKPEKAVAR